MRVADSRGRQVVWAMEQRIEAEEETRWRKTKKWWLVK